jgi:MYXO-CTERM domain-containing protein
MPRLPTLPAYLLLALAPACAAAPEPAPRTRAHQLPVIHGEPSEPGEYPAVGALWTGDVACTGTLIRADVVLTAAHCVDPELVGDARIDFTLEHDPSGVPSPVIHTGCGTVKHEQFTLDVEDLAGLQQFYDVGLVFLAEPIAGATTMEMATPEEAAALAAGLDLELVGYGVTSEETFDYGVKFDAVTDLVAFNESELQISMPGTAQNCYGDSGGPAIAQLGGQPRLVGIVSRSATNNGNCAEGGIDTRVDYYRQWILDRIAERDLTGSCEPVVLPPDAGVEADAETPPNDAGADEPDAGEPAVDGEPPAGCCSTGGAGGAPAGALALGLVVGVALRRRRRTDATAER